MAKVGPLTPFQPQEEQRNIVMARKPSVRLPGILSAHRSASSLNAEKFNELISSDFASGFEESEACFTELTGKAAAILGADACFIFLKDNKEQKLYTYLKADDGAAVRVTKPVDRGITGSVLEDPEGLNVHNVATSRRWSYDLDEVPKINTVSYLAWPIWDAGEGNSIGVVEFRNKDRGEGTFDAADSQLARIVAFQLGTAAIHNRQQEFLAGRTEEFHKAYEKSFDKAEAITISLNDDSSRDALIRTPKSPAARSMQRGAFTMAPSAQLLLNTRRIGTEFGERGWDYDVFLYSEEDLITHAIDVFDERGLFARWNIPMATFVNFLNEIRAGYSSVAPYHNCFHAFDVMHVCYLLISQCKADEYLESFNILSILVAALGHDLGHDGFNNAFHGNTNSELAVTYNGVSILENYSAAYLFRILRKGECNIFNRLSSEDMSKMRSRLIDLILDTDAKNHFMLMTRFKHGLEMKQLSRGLLSSMILHVSDVSNPTRPGSIARKWAFAVQEEFFRQGDREKELDLPRSPFMDRDFENLPRMQGAFIDAICSPVFKLLADFLPLVKEHCLKPLQINRAFWNNMQNQDIITSRDIQAFLKSHQKNDATIPLAVLTDSANGSEGGESDISISDDPIPGIPQNAPHNLEYAHMRKMSLISLNTDLTDAVDPELGVGYDGTFNKSSIRLMSPRRSLRQLRETKRVLIKKLKAKISKLLDSHFFQSLMLLATVYALFANDVNLAVGTKDTDAAVDIATFCVLCLFVAELMMSIICVKKYMHFFFWLDLAASISLILEVDFLLELGSGQESPDELSLAKASRAAKAGARAGRLARVLRLLRLLKIVKVMKWMFGFIRKRDEKLEDEYDVEEEVDFKMSIVGRKMTESITKKVIIAVMLMLLVFSLVDVSFTPDARQLQLDAIAEYPDSSLLQEVFFQAHDNIIELRTWDSFFRDENRKDELRDVEILTLRATTNSSVVASFDLSEETSITAWYSVFTTMIVTCLLAALSLLFSRDAYRIMIRPIEKMKYTVQQLSENPLLHLERMKKRGGASDANETDMLQQAINKMATLLQVGFGCAGAEIIAKSLSDEGELDPMVPGVRVNAIFGFCDIRDFTFATEGLQQDVMLFVNKVAAITHKHVVDSGGAPNKNIGDAFLLVWKLASSKNGGRSNLQKDLFDAALMSIQKIIADIRSMGNLAAFLQEETDSNAAWRSSLEDFRVAMGFGLHTGWAIEGSIGSKVKVDASYLSPHVNLASRLEAATKHYRVPLLMSEAFISGLTGAVQSTCRRCDSVIFKGSTEPMHIYHQDIEPFDQLQAKPDNYADLLSATSWKDESELKDAGVDVAEAIKNLASEKSLAVREVYDHAFNAYLDGQWDRCKVLCHLWLERFPGDVLVHRLVEFLVSHNFVPPADWSGYHALREK